MAQPMSNVEDKEISKKMSKDSESQTCNETILNIGQKIAEGASAFIWAEYFVLFCFLLGFALVVYLLVDILGTDNSKLKFVPYGTLCFLVGAFTSMACGYIGLKVAVMSNYKTTYKAISSLEEAFDTSYRGGCAFGFATLGISLVI